MRRICKWLKRERDTRDEIEITVRETRYRQSRDRGQKAITVYELTDIVQGMRAGKIVVNRRHTRTKTRGDPSERVRFVE